MNRKRLLCIVPLLFLFTLTGCFDLETEVRFFRDGSGFVTQWVRMDLADVTAAAAMNKSSVSDWTSQVLAALDANFVEVPGVSLLDKQVFNVTDRIVLRYRFGFESAAALGTFLAQPEISDQYIYPSGGVFQFKANPASCGGSYRADFRFAPRNSETLERFDYPDIDDLPIEHKESVIRKFFSGSFKLRVVLPGKTKSHNAPNEDGQGYPVYDMKILDFFRKGVVGSVKSVLDCSKGQPGDPELDPKKIPPITRGNIATPEELLRVAGSLSNYLDIFYEFDCDKYGRVKMAVTFFVAEPLRAPFEFYFPMLFPVFPALETDYNQSLNPVAPGLYKYRFESKKPIKLGKKKSHYVYFGKEKLYWVFRMNLPKMAFGELPAPHTASSALVRVRVTMPAKIRVSNATEISENTGFWMIPDRNFQEHRIVIEALTE